MPLLAGLSDVETMNLDYDTTSLSLGFHPLQFLRHELERAGVLTSRQLASAPHGKQVKVAGWTVVRQRPGEGKMLFFTLEDEFGAANLMLTPKTFEQHREAALSPLPVVAQGKVERSGEVVHLRVKTIQVFESEQENNDAAKLPTASRDFH
jgi:error-prone DNA polymerase